MRPGSLTGFSDAVCARIIDALITISYIFGPVLALTVGYVLAMRALRRFAKRTYHVPPQPSFDLSELQSMVEKGLISPEEFERLKGLIIAQRASVDAGRKFTGFEVIPIAQPHDPK
jgi:hypothetical protein